MAGYQTIEALRPILHRGPVPMPIVDRALVGRAAPSEPQAKEQRYVRQGTRDVIAPSIVAEIESRRARGESYGKIADAVKVAKSTVIKHARDIKTPLGRKMNCWEGGKRRKTEWNVGFAERLRRSGFSYKEIGENLGCAEDTARKVLGHMPKNSCVYTPTHRMVPRVAKATGISCKELRRAQFDSGSKTVTGQCKARHILFWALRTYYGFSFKEIGRSVGGFHHTSIMHGCRRAEVVANAIGVSKSTPPLTAAKRLWGVDWREVLK